MSGIVLVYSLFGSAERARAVTRTLVEERLAACANILGPCTSIYEWQGKVEEGAEVPVLFKTSADRRDALMARIAQLHDYDVPAILALPVDAAHPPFAAWGAEQLA
ncbi:divalent cation tolerance protein CutA [Sphingobium yanoikuyae]|uniref:Divalent cation tolerance protein CutA n=1 Tax=Sphingobium yanoikuyae TaxID=13690 RepID=A0A6P1GBR2_SPHYA|nr:divalent-cation tolerance protein CutA [Sphingobium yanoikuyae]QHD65889.1 divalent cation tolerance protein CutA [Sphingobium yanoikuyae]